jgi:RNA polymerase primary sigma factor
MKQLIIGKQITNRENLSLDRYLVEIAKLDLITGEREAELARKIREGDAIALEKLTKANLRFVVSVAKQYQNNGISLNDLINEGNIGLIKAGQRFDETRGFKFISYAVWWIRQSIMQALTEQSRVVRLPLNRVGTLNKIYRKQGELEQQFLREPSEEELAEALSLSTEDVRENLSVAARHYSIDAPFQQGEDNTLLDVITNTESAAPDSTIVSDSLAIELERVLRTLTSREAEVLRLFYGLSGSAPQSLAEIADKFVLTRERVRQIKEKAIGSLRRSIRNRAVTAFFS